jgi:hypothetical protein
LLEGIHHPPVINALPHDGDSPHRSLLTASPVSCCAVRPLRLPHSALRPSLKRSRIGFDIPAPPCQHRAMLGALENQFSLTRAGASAYVRAKSSFLSVKGALA